MAQVASMGIIFHLNYPCQPSGIQSPREGTNLTLLWSSANQETMVHGEYSSATLPALQRRLMEYKTQDLHGPLFKYLKATVHIAGRSAAL